MNPETLLSDYFSQSYAPARNLRPSTIEKSLRAIGRLSAVLGHPATVADATADELPSAVVRLQKTDRQFVGAVARSLGGMSDPSLRVNRTAQEWHCRPRGFTGPCPICGCAVLGEHRLTKPEDGLQTKWIVRTPVGKRMSYRGVSETDSRPEPDRAPDGLALPPLVEIAPSPKAIEAGHIGLADYYLQKFEPNKLRSRTSRTKKLYRTTLRTFTKFLGRGPVLRDLNGETVTAFLSWCRDQKYSPFTTEKERCNLLAIWRFACRRGDLTVWPEIDREKCPKRVPTAWTLAELRKLVTHLQGLPGKVGDVPAAAFWTGLVLVCWDAGERITAVFGLTWDRVDLERGWIVCRAEDRKGQREDRSYQLGEDTVAVLKQLWRPDAERVFPWPYHPTYLWKRYGAILKRAGLPHDARSKFHKIRRSAASYMEANGMSATEWLGHTKREITKAYLDPRIVKPPQAVDVLERITSEVGRPAQPRETLAGQERGE